MKKKFEDLSTRYGSVTMSIFETAWKDDQKTITVKVEDAPDTNAAVIGISRRMVVNRSDDLYCKRMGRKNWLFANTPAGAQSSAVIYSLIETAKENELDPYRYLLWVLQSAPVLSQADEFWAEKLLPTNAPQECHVPQ